MASIELTARKKSSVRKSARQGNQVAPRADATAGIPDPDLMLLFDSQTSGGLLLCVPAEKRVGEMEQPVWVVGKAREGDGIGSQEALLQRRIAPS